MIPTLEWTSEGVRFLDQTRLPLEETFVLAKTYQDVADVITRMVVRGAPAIGVSAAMGVALGARHSMANSLPALLAEIRVVGKALAATRPTAVNLFWAIERMRRHAAELAAQPGATVATVKQGLIAEAQRMYDEDIAACRALGAFGAELLPQKAGVLTHCNAGALATCGYGTALGVIRAAVEAGHKIEVYADETRPFLQGARLTAWELMQDGIPTTVICDNMAASLMQAGKLQAIVVGADRIAANGDVANKIGTYGASGAREGTRHPLLCRRPPGPPSTLQPKPGPTSPSSSAPPQRSPTTPASNSRRITSASGIRPSTSRRRNTSPPSSPNAACCARPTPSRWPTKRTRPSL